MNQAKGSIFELDQRLTKLLRGVHQPEPYALFYIPYFFTMTYSTMAFPMGFFLDYKFNLDIILFDFHCNRISVFEIEISFLHGIYGKLMGLTVYGVRGSIPCQFRLRTFYCTIRQFTWMDGRAWVCCSA